MRPFQWLLIGTVIAALALQGQAQDQHKNQERGLSENGVYSTGDIDHINLFNGNLLLTIPIGRPFMVGGQLSYSFTLVYNSSAWSQREVCPSTIDLVQLSSTFLSVMTRMECCYTNETGQHRFPVSDETTVGGLPGSNDPYGPRAARSGADDCWTVNEPNPGTNAGMGWQLTLGKLYQPRNDPYDNRPNFTEKSLWVYMSPDGSEHTFYGKLHEDDPQDSPNIWYTRDGSYLRLNTNLPVNGYGNMMIEFPNGVKHYFTPITVRERNDSLQIREIIEEKLSRMEDQFGNFVNSTYLDDSTDTDTLKDNKWVITDSLNRTQTIDYAKRATDFQNVIVGVTLQAFGNLTTHYGFNYSSATLDRPSPHVPPGLIDGVGDQVNVPFLTAVELDDGSQYQMPLATSYFVPPMGTVSTRQALIQKIRLPSGGSIEWKYEAEDPVQDRADGYGYRFGLMSAGRYYHRSSMGVRRRIVSLNNGGQQQIYLWKYDPKLGANVPTGCVPYSLNDRCAPAEIVNTVTTPEGDYTKYYFSVWPFPYDDYGLEPLRRGISDLHGSDYGLPFTKDPRAQDDVVKDPPRNILDGNGLPLFLSQVMYDKTGKKRRSTYARYEGDVITLGDGFGSSVDANTRVVAGRTVYHDDADKYTEVQYSNFDGLGHYRAKRDSGNFGTNPQRIEIINYNPDRGSYLIDPVLNARGQGFTYTTFPENRAWIIDTYDTQIVGDYTKRTASFYNFDNNGLLLSKRIMKEFDNADSASYNQNPSSFIYNLAANDILIKYDYREPDGVVRGNLTAERYYGGDKQNNLSGADLRTTTQYLSDSASEYTIFRSYPRCGSSTLGIAKTVQFNGVDFKSTDYDVDCNTGLIKAARDTAGNEIKYFYDTFGRMTDVIRQQGNNTKYKYNPVQPGSVTDSPSTDVYQRVNGDFSSNNYLDEEEYIYDQLGRLIIEKQKQASGNFSVRYTTYNGLNWKTSVSEWLSPQSSVDGKLTIFSDFDPFGRAWTATLPDGKQLRQEFKGVREIHRSAGVGTQLDSTGTVIETNADKWERYDPFGRLYQVVEPSGPGGQNVTTNYSYNVLNKLTSACSTGSGATQCRSFGYDGRGYLRTEALPERPSSKYDDYDTRGNVGKSYDGVHWLRYFYDQAGRRSRIEEPIDSTMATWRPVKEFSYYANGAINGGTFSRGKLATSTRHNWVLDPLNPSAATESDVVVTEQYVYSGLDGGISEKKITTNKAGIGFQQSFSYDQLGNLASQNYPQCTNATCTSTLSRITRVGSYIYTNGMLTNVSGTGDGGIVSQYASYSYQENGTHANITHGNGIADINFIDANSMLRPTRIRARNNRTATIIWDSGRYAYDAAGNITNIGSDWYLYDKVNRLLEGTALSSGRKQRYSFDTFGNILTTDTYDSVTASGARLINHSVSNANAANNRLNELVYDAAGNVRGASNPSNPSNPAIYYAYDALNRMKSAPGLTYIYGPNDERFWLADRQGAQVISTITLRGLNNELLREYRLSGANVNGNWSWQKDYIYGGTRLIASESQSGARHYHLDHLGTPRVITDQNGNMLGGRAYQYFPFGDDVALAAPLVTSSLSPPEERLKFTGQEYSPDYSGLNLTYMHARFYKPGWGKFLSVDPGRDTDTKQPQSWNLYTYARNNPVRLNDPTGKQTSALLNQNSCVPGVEYPTTFQLFVQLYQWTWLDSYLMTRRDSIQSGPLEAAILKWSPVARSLWAARAARAVAAEGADALAAAAVKDGAGKKMITVLGSRADTAKYIGKEGYNVLNVENWSYEINGKWLGQALTRGDDFLLVTNPAEFRAIMNATGNESIFLENELPALQTWFGTSVDLLGGVPK